MKARAFSPPLSVARTAVGVGTSIVLTTDGFQVGSASNVIGHCFGSCPLAIANAVVFLAVAPKSNAVYVAVAEAKEDVERFGTLDVPARFRNAPTKLMKELGHGAGYRYAHDEPGAYAAGERYLPDEMPDRRYSRPVPRGLEIKIGEALARLRGKGEPDKTSND